MSYILDALKKSERERSLGHVPTLSTVHSYPKSHASRRWSWLVLVLSIMLVLIGVAIYGVMFWGQDDVVQSASEKTHTESASASAGRVSQPQKPASPAATKPALTNVDPPQAEMKRPEPVEPPSSRVATTTQSSSSYPTLDDLDEGMRQRLSNIVVNVVSYSEQPSRRFVMINQKIYRRGQSVNGQLEVVAIKPQGAILRFQGREFLAVP